MENAMSVDTMGESSHGPAHSVQQQNENTNNVPMNGGHASEDRTRSRPSRESVLKRLSEALMRRSLTKIDLSQRGLRPSDARLVKMALFQNSRLVVLKLGYNNLGDEGITILAPGIASHKALVSLDLGFNGIGDKGCRALAVGLASCQVNTLYLAGNVFGEDGALALADVIGRNIKRLHLTGNRIGPDGVKAITEAVIGERHQQRDCNDSVDHDEKRPLNHDVSPSPAAAGLVELFLGGTGMGPRGCKAVARMLEFSTTIRVISLANCAIGDAELGMLAAGIKRNGARLPLEALQLSFNEITAKGLDFLINALWGSTTLRELRLDNNEIRDRGAEQVAAILPNIKTLEVVDVGFNSIKSNGIRKLMRVVAQTHHLVSLSVSGNPIDTAAAKLVAYALAYNQSLKCLSLVHCSIDHGGQRHITAGIVSNRGIALRKLTGFELGPIIVTIKFPAAMERWTNEQVLDFLHRMWEPRDDEANGPDAEEVDPLHFLPQASSQPSGSAKRTEGPLDATIVVEVAQRAFESLRVSGQEITTCESCASYCEPSFGSPLAPEDAIILEGPDDGGRRTLAHQGTRSFGFSVDSENPNDQAFRDAVYANVSASFVAAPPAPAKQSFPDPDRKRRIEAWLSKNVQHMNELAQQPFDSTELWRLHQHYFAPVVKESGGEIPSSPTLSTNAESRIVSSVPEVYRNNNGSVEPCSITPSTLSSDDHLLIGSSDPSMPASPPGVSLPMLKRKVSYRFLGDAGISSSTHAPSMSEVRSQSVAGASVSRLIEGRGVGHSMPPKSKRARRNKTRISFLPRIKEKLDSFLDTDHEKALILMRQLFYVEQALLSSKINPCPAATGGCSHLSGELAAEAQMVLLDMM